MPAQIVCLITTISLDFFISETLAYGKHELSDHGEAAQSEIQWHKGRGS